MKSTNLEKDTPPHTHHTFKPDRVPENCLADPEINPFINVSNHH